MSSLQIHDAVWMEERRLSERLKALVSLYAVHVPYALYPLDYASAVFQNFLWKFCSSEKPILFLGMNPGPFGMVQNGVPFGDTYFVREWLQLEGEIYQPEHEHPYRPILGWSMTRPEISGQRLWGLIQEVCGQPDIFFNNCFIRNYCPLAFLDSQGRNVPLPKLPLVFRKQLINICDESLFNILNILNVKLIICIGRFVESCVKRLLRKYNLSGIIQIVTLPHPSTRNMLNAHCNWKANVMQKLTDLDVIQYLQGVRYV